MTATHVNGLAVVADEPTLSPLSKPGKPVYFGRIRELLLEDGSILYGCVHCTETSAQVGKIRVHLKTHNPTPNETNAATRRSGSRKTTTTPARTASASESPATAPATPASQLGSLTLTELATRLGELADFDQLRADRDTWRTRALTAEKTLHDIREALGR